jgi:hypothetical protein
VAKIRSMMEVRPVELTPAMRNFGPFDNIRLLRWGWFKWFWLGDTKDDIANYTLLIGPFRTRGRARRAWDNPFLKNKEKAEELSKAKWQQEIDTDDYKIR